MRRPVFQPPNRVSQPYKDRIPQSIWNEYKDNILREYACGGKFGLKQVQNWVKLQRNPRFRPSRKQLDRQVKNWLDSNYCPVSHQPQVDQDFNHVVGNTYVDCGGTKQDLGLKLTSDPNDTCATIAYGEEQIYLRTSEVSPCCAKDDIIQEEKQRISGLNDYPPSSDIMTKKHSPGKEKPPVQTLEQSEPRWRQNDHDQGSLSSPHSRGRQKEWKSPEVFLLTLVEGSLSNWVSPQAISIKIVDEISSSTRYRHGEPRGHQSISPVSPVNKPKIEVSRILRILRFIEIRWRIEETDEFQADPQKLFQASLYGKHKLNLIREAADYFSSGVHSKWEENVNFLISSVWTARTTKELQLSRELVEHSLSRLEELEHATFEVLLLRIAHMRLLLSLDESNAWGTEKQNTSHKQLTAEQLLATLQNSASSFHAQLNLFTYSVLYYGLRFWDYNSVEQIAASAYTGKQGTVEPQDSTRTTLGRLQNILILKIAGPSSIEIGRFGKIHLRECLEWCSSVLEDDNLLVLYPTHPLPEYLRAWRSNATSKRCAELISLFSYFWMQWKKRKISTDCFIHWNENTERAMGLSISELLSKISLLIVNHSRVEETVSQLRVSIKSPDMRLIQRWCRGATKLLNMTDSELIRSFLSSFTGPKHDMPAEIPDTFDVEDYQKEHRVQFLAGMREEDPSRSAPMYEMYIRKSATSALDIEQTLTSFPSSSTLKSMERIAQSTTEKLHRKSPTSNRWTRIAGEISDRIRRFV